MQLIDAKFCIDCEEIFIGKTCPACGRMHTIFLSEWVKSFKRFRR